jgi:hypothetical protein
MVIWYIFPLSGCRSKKNLATLCRTASNSDLNHFTHLLLVSETPESNPFLNLAHQSVDRLKIWCLIFRKRRFVVQMGGSDAENQFRAAEQSGSTPFMRRFYFKWITFNPEITYRNL